MLSVRPSDQRGHFDHGWLDTCHTFSFGEYYDPRFMRFRTLRVINEDVVQPGGGFPMHGHRDMEIITFILSGALEHRDSLGNGTVIRPGEIQVMSAGTGVEHSEFNPSPTEPVHLMQIWILPEQRGLSPGYQQQEIPRTGGAPLTLLASRKGRDRSAIIHQDADVYLGDLSAGVEHSFSLGPSRQAWVQMMRGRMNVGGVKLRAGDGLSAASEPNLLMRADERSEFLLFDLG